MRSRNTTPNNPPMNYAMFFTNTGKRSIKVISLDRSVLNTIRSSKSSLAKDASVTSRLIQQGIHQLLTST